MKRLTSLFGRLLILAVFIGAAYLLYHNLFQATKTHLGRQPVGLGEVMGVIWDAVLETPWRAVVAALFLSFAGYVISVGYDWLAVRWIGAHLPLWKIAWVSFVSYAFSYNFGATLFGTSIRWRFYSSWGLSLVKILELLLILGLTFWFGLFALAGTLFVVDPLVLPDELIEATGTTIHNTYWFGWLLLSLAIGYVGLASLFAVLHRGQLRIRNWVIPIPAPRLTLYQIAIASGDLMVAAGCLHVVLPPMDGVTYFTTLGVFMLAFTLSVLTHVPGGYGVFELTTIAFMPHEFRLQIFAAILVFRAAYYWVPLLFGSALLIAHEVAIRGEDIPPVPPEVNKHAHLTTHH
jgi:hypothetical protein